MRFPWWVLRLENLHIEVAELLCQRIAGKATWKLHADRAAVGGLMLIWYMSCVDDFCEWLRIEWDFGGCSLVLETMDDGNLRSRDKLYWIGKSQEMNASRSVGSTEIKGCQDRGVLIAEWSHYHLPHEVSIIYSNHSVRILGLIWMAIPPSRSDLHEWSWGVKNLKSTIILVNAFC